MQNKPNVRKSQMNVSNIITRNYKILSRLRGKKTNPIQTQSNPISKMPKMNANIFITKDYRKNDCLAPQKTNPIQTQSPKGQNRLPENLATPAISYSVDIPLMESTAMV